LAGTPTPSRLSPLSHRNNTPVRRGGIVVSGPLHVVQKPTVCKKQYSSFLSFLNTAYRVKTGDSCCIKATTRGDQGRRPESCSPRRAPRWDRGTFRLIPWPKGKGRVSGSAATLQEAFSLRPAPQRPGLRGPNPDCVLKDTLC